MGASTVEDSGYIQRVEKLFESSRQSTLECIAQGCETNLMQNIEFGIQDPDSVRLRSGRRRTNDELKLLLKNLWWKTIEAAKLFPADDEARQWRLVAWIAGAKARGDLPSLQQDPYVGDGGKILWKDLPFFQGALERVWANRSKLSKSEWCNLNAFVARLVAVTGLDLIHLGLETIRDALEVEMSVFPTGEGEHVPRSVSELLPAALCWFTSTCEVLRVRTIVNERALKDGSELQESGRRVSPGVLAQADGVHRDGLSLARQRFWRLRLAEIGREQESGPDGDLTMQTAYDQARKLGTWNFGWPEDLNDVQGWEEPVRYQDSDSE